MGSPGERGTDEATGLNHSYWWRGSVAACGARTTAKKFPLIGVLVSASPPHPFADAFWRGLHALGYSDGENIKVEFRYTDGQSDRAEEYAEVLVRLSPDVIVEHYVLAVKSVISSTRTIPIVMAQYDALSLL